MKIEIFDTTWTVKVVNERSTELFESDGMICRGKCNSAVNEIVIAEGLIPSKLYEVLTHELTHAVIKQMLMNKEDFIQEEVCEFMERYGNYICILARNTFEKINKNGE